MKKILVAAVLFCSSFFVANAQFETNEQNAFSFRHLDFGISAGTTGLGFDLALPFHEQFRVRAGFSFIPKFNKKINFGVERINDDNKDNLLLTNFDSMADKLSDLTGLKIKDNIDMLGSPNFYNGNLLVDFYPIKKCAFRITAGFYWGGSKVASAQNSIDDMSTPLVVTMYNNFYKKFENYEPLFGDPEVGDDFYLEPPVEDEIRDLLMSFGRLGFYVGDKVSDGTHYIMEPDENGTVKVNVFVNSFKPYLGTGYGGNLTKNGSTKLEFDAGVLFWGGTPEVIVHDGTDLAKDLVNVRGKVGRYVNFIKGIKVYPVVNLRLSFRLF